MNVNLFYHKTQSYLPQNISFMHSFKKINSSVYFFHTSTHCPDNSFKIYCVFVSWTIVHQNLIVHMLIAISSA